MSNTELMNKMSGTIHKISFKLQKHSPEILIVAGVVGTVASGIMACKATLKVNDILEESKENREKIEEASETGVTEAGKEYTEEDRKKDITINTAQTGWKLIKLYSGPIILGTLSLGAIIASNNILRKRNISLASAYAALDKGFKEYRGHVVERYGKDVDYQLRHNIKAVDTEKTKTKEDGTVETETVTQDQIQSDASIYAKFFDASCAGWTKDPELNLMFLKKQEAYANQRLKTVKHVFLNEVYDMLGLPRTKAGQCVGWIYDEENPLGDNYIDFGIHPVDASEATRRFVNGLENVILLDFNVDGNILNCI